LPKQERVDNGYTRPSFGRPQLSASPPRFLKDFELIADQAA
jgi:hypothetical protein